MKNASNLGMVNNNDESEDNLDILGDFKWIIILIIDIKIIFFSNRYVQLFLTPHFTPQVQIIYDLEIISENDTICIPLNPWSFWFVLNYVGAKSQPKFFILSTSDLRLPYTGQAEWKSAFNRYAIYLEL